VAVDELLGRWWNGQRDRLGRRDIWLTTNGTVWSVRARQDRNSGSGREVHHKFRHEYEARALVGRLIATAPGRWKDVTRLVDRSRPSRTEDGDRERIALDGLHGRRTVRRWRYETPANPHSLQHVSIGWWPDGRWWVQLTGERLGWRFQTEEPAWRLVEQIHAAEPDLWSEAPAEYVPGTTESTAAPRYPPGHGPADAR
jgi:hypothetical protein